MRLYRGLAEPWDRQKDNANRKPGDRPDFTDCPFAALEYARGGRGVLLVLEIPDADAERVVREELWLRDDAKRFHILRDFAGFVVATLAAKELRAEMKRQGMSKLSITNADRSWRLRGIVERSLAAVRA